MTDFALIRSSDGLKEDTRLHANATGARTVGLPYTFYHFYRPNVDVFQQVVMMETAANQYGINMAPILDLEHSDPVPADHADRVWLYLKELTKRLQLPRPLVIYTNLDYWINVMGSPEWGADYDLHIAAWGNFDNPVVPAPWDRWLLWQHSSTGDGATYGAGSKFIDLNWFNGSEEELSAYLFDRPPKPVPEPFRFEVWPTDYKVVMQEFGANPQDYDQFGLPGHEGVDIRAPLNTPVRAVATGQVYDVSDHTNYGRQVRIVHRDGYKTVYAHLEKRAVAFADWVQAGQVIGYAGNTGNSKAPHLHLTLRRDGVDLPGWPPMIIDPTPFLIPFNPSWPGGSPGTPGPAPQPAAVDMASYFFPASGNYGDILILENNWGAGDERQQLQRDGELSFVTKNQQWERRRITAAGVYLEMDTSPGEGEYYTCSGLGFPRSWRPGESFTRTERISFYQKIDCKPVTTKPPYDSTSTIRFEALHPAWTSPTGIKLINVIEFAWILKGAIEERYWYAPHLGLVQWKNKAGRHSWIVERIPLGQQGNNMREVLPCAG
jgi:hypothetical protein